MNQNLNGMRDKNNMKYQNNVKYFCMIRDLFEYMSVEIVGKVGKWDTYMISIPNSNIREIFNKSGIDYCEFENLIQDIAKQLFEKGKEVIFNELYINNSSYRRCKEKEQGVGPEIISKLTTYYNIKEVNNEDIDNYEILLNDLYTNIYYKNTDNYEEDLNKLETLIAENNLMSPVFKLIRLLLLLN